MGEQQKQQQQPPSPSDATLTKVFIGGLAWETQRKTLCDYFSKFGDILEAVVITNKLTGRSKGYGFVTFKEADSAKKACEDAAPIINGRKANCNIAYLGARRGVAGKISPAASPASFSPCAATAAVPWYFSSGTSPSTHTVSPFQQHYHGVVLPFYASTYGYSPSFVAPTNMCYGPSLWKPNRTGAGGVYIPSQFRYLAQGRGMMLLVAMDPVYLHQHLHSHRLHHNRGNSDIHTAQFIPAVNSGAVRGTSTSKISSCLGSSHCFCRQP